MRLPNFRFEKLAWKFNGAPVYQVVAAHRELGWVARPTQNSRCWINSHFDRRYYPTRQDAAKPLWLILVKRLQREAKELAAIAD